ncbi:PepSY domain-containing protein [Bradyrhizobium sp. 31Argb]|uniref:PepSY domain-containing protein n=1 Tax=unclassified Bradyrhizobium TaxID=2631580 RepID=UPI00249F0648|nr:PepSY domain-containing protein [Bradyrhizobium sp. Arg237L]MDI4238449.1 PepSY domain-containing protein [Bradyrhizobium sp. Arg237L]
MTRRKLLLTSAAGLVIIGLTVLSVGPGHAAGDDEDEGVLIRLLGTAKVSLQQALVTSEREGQPISGKFEAEDGKLQLSIYTAKDGKFFEVIVDHMTGEIGKVEPITEGEDLEHAEAQKAALDRAKVTLAAAVAKAKGYGARIIVVSAVPELKNGQPIASLGFLNEEKLATVTEPLD